MANATADASGHWVFKKAPAGSYQVVIEADGYVPRIAGYAQFDGQACWQSYDCGLSKPAPVLGRVSDDAGKPLADVNVRLGDVVSSDGGRYETPGEYRFTTDAEGRFRAEMVPRGKASIWIYKTGYCRPGLGQPVITPSDDVELAMTPAAAVAITVDFSKTVRPGGYVVHMAPEGGPRKGKWSGSGNIDAKDQISFVDVPPGKYVLRGRPNPGGDKDETEHVTIHLQGGKTTQITLTAK